MYCSLRVNTVDYCLARADTTLKTGEVEVEKENMQTTTLYITEAGTSVRKNDERIVLYRENRPVADVPMLHLRRVAVFGRGIDITTEAMLALVERKIDLCFFSRNLQFRARVNGEISLNGQLRFLQARFVDNPAQQLALAKTFIQGKLSNQQHALPPTARPVARRMESLLTNLLNAPDLDSLRGFEGQGAALYFAALREAIPLLREWGFNRREYYPPPDPINALLSYGYSLMTREALAALHLTGFDPHLGFFHAIDYGRPSLALDLVEEFRPMIDMLVLRLIQDKFVTRAEFERVNVNNPEAPPGTPAVVTWRLKPAARKRFLEIYEKQMATRFPYANGFEITSQTLRNIIELQARQLARLILGEVHSYEPFKL